MQVSYPASTLPGRESTLEWEKAVCCADSTDNFHRLARLLDRYLPMYNLHEVDGFSRWVVEDSQQKWAIEESANGLHVLHSTRPLVSLRYIKLLHSTLFS